LNRAAGSVVRKRESYKKGWMEMEAAANSNLERYEVTVHAVAYRRHADTCAHAAIRARAHTCLHRIRDTYSEYHGTQVPVVQVAGRVINAHASARNARAGFQNVFYVLKK
jgi:hypothetical protein